MSNQSEPNAGGNNPDGNLSSEQLTAALTQGYTSQEESAPDQVEAEQETEEDQETETQETESETETETEEEETEEEDEIESALDTILSWEPDEIAAFAKKGNSKLLKRLGELTAQKKSLIEQQANSQAEAKPLPKAIPDNPFSKLKSMAEVDAETEKLEKVAEDTESLLEEYTDYSLDDEIDVGGQKFTKRQIKDANRNATKALSKFLPAQRAEIERSGQRQQEKAMYDAALLKEIPELNDEESELSQGLKVSMEDETLFAELLGTPSAPRAKYVIAHALRSINQIHKKAKTGAATAPGTKPRPKVPGSPVGAAAAPANAGLRKSAVQDKALTTGNESDMVAWIASQQPNISNANL